MKTTRFILAITTSALLTAGSALAAPPPIRLDNVASGFSLPLGFVQDPSNPSVQYVLQQRGRIRVLVNGVVQANDLLDLTGVASTSGSERGLMGLAFPPNYAQDGRLYVNYTRNSDGATIVARFQRDPNNPLRALPGSQEILLTIAQPFSNHNGGNLVFGPDGYLYIGNGDGGSGGDPNHLAQNPNSLLGKMLRIDVSPTTGYAIPADNPFVDNDPIPARHEIWAFGVRNPWRWSFDNPALGGTGAMVMADVGQNAWEEINYEPAGRGGRNYGWRLREGAHNYDTSLPAAYTPLTEPIHEYSHTVGRSITGGFVYRGYNLGSAWQGRYFFADYVLGKIFSMQITTNQQGEGVASDVREHTAELGGSSFIGNVASFGEDSSGELYVVSFNGTVRRLAPQQSPYIYGDTFTRVRGLPVSGDLESLKFNDDNRLETRPDVFRTSSVPPVQVRVDGTCPVANPSELRFTLESRADRANINQRILLYNFFTDQYDQVNTRILTTSDVTVQIVNTTNPAQYVNPNNRRVRALIQCNAIAFSIAPVWVTGIDRAVWEFSP